MAKLYKFYPAKIRYIQDYTSADGSYATIIDALSSSTHDVYLS